MIRLRSRHTSPPNGWMVTPPLVPKEIQVWSFGAACQHARVHNPTMAMLDIERQIETENALRCLSIGAGNFTYADPNPDPSWPKDNGESKLFIQLGRFGDLILLLPAFLETFVRTGHKPRVIVAREYASLFDGVGYVQPLVLNDHWYTGMPEARKMAKAIAEEAVVTQCHGIDWGVDMSLWPNYMTSMWERAGFTVEEMMRLPLMFNRRNREREAKLVSRCRANNPKPMLLYNGTGISSPCPKWKLMMGFLQGFAQDFNLVDLGAIRAERIYDLLGLMDAAAGMVTIDTATLHLCPATKMPYVALIRSDWNRSTPRGNCHQTIYYEDFDQHLKQTEKVINAWNQKPLNT